MVGIAIAEFGAAPARHPDLRRGEAPVAPFRTAPADDALQIDAIIRTDITTLLLVVSRFAADRAGIAIAGTHRPDDLRSTRPRRLNLGTTGARRLDLGAARVWIRQRRRLRHQIGRRH